MSRKQQEAETPSPPVDPKIPTDPALLSAWLIENHDKIGLYVHVQCACLLALANAVTEAAWAICDMGEIHAELTLRRVKEQAKQVFPRDDARGGVM